MQLKNITVVYFSPTGTTRRTLHAVSDGIGIPVASELDITLPAPRSTTPSFTSEDFVVFASPVYGGRLPLLVENYFRTIKGNNTPCVLLAVYGNRDFDDCLVEMEDILSENGFLPFAAGAFIGEHSFTSEIATSRPDAEDLRFARSFGKDILAKIIRTKSPAALVSGAIPGGRPYRDRGPAVEMAPSTNSDCIDCKLCAKKCPVGAISFDDVFVVDASLCLRCLNCVRVCPTKAKQFTSDAFKGTVAWCLENFKDPRKEPALFL